jgi:hypothetical protein
MARQLVFLALTGILALTSWSCGSTVQVSGDWSGTVRPAHFDILQISLTQDGKIIRGTACYVIGNGVPTNTVKFRDATVNGSYPTIRVVAADGWIFEGEFQDDTLSGHYRTPTSAGSNMYLTRGSGPHGPYCK